VVGQAEHLLRFGWGHILLVVCIISHYLSLRRSSRLEVTHTIHVA